MGSDLTERGASPDRTSGYFDSQTETMSRPEREGYVLGKLRAALEHGYTNAPSVKSLMDQAGVGPQDVQSLEDLERLPVLRKDQLVDLQKQHPPFGGLLGVPPEKVGHVYMSPGPLYEPHSYSARNVAQALYAGGIRPRDIVQVTYAYHLVPAGPMMEEGLLALGCTVIPGGTGNTELQIQMMRDLGVTGYLGTPSFLATLLERAAQIGLRPGEGLALVAAGVGAEPLPESLRQELENRYDLLVRQGYGSADLGVMAYECFHKGGMHLVDDLSVEVVDPTTGKALKSGEIGEVVVTSFSQVYCLIRLGTGDAAYVTDDPCPCGRTAPRIGRIVGRVGEAIKVRGMFVHPRQLDEAMVQFPDVVRYRVLVTREGYRDQMTLQVEMKAGQEVLSGLSEALAEAVRDTTKLRADRIESVGPGNISEEDRKIVDQRQWE